jgi:hypothetical protein
MILATFSTAPLASAQSPASTASRIAGKMDASWEFHSCGPKMTCLNWVRFGICTCLVSRDVFFGHVLKRDGVIGIVALPD